MKIEFKRVKNVDFSKIFPVISEADYKLLAGHSLIIPDAEYDKIQKKGFLVVGTFQISKDLIEIAKGQSFDPIQQEIQSEINKRSIYSEDMVDILSRAIRLEKNVLMYGRGGHNKSEGTIDILNEMKAKGLITSEPFVMSFGDGLTEESLFGGINIKKFKDTGHLEYLFENSFMEHEIVIFEEIFDAPPQVLLSLKDILTSGWCRKGNQLHKSKTKVVIGLTNKCKEDFSEDDSLEALTQRFPLTLKVEWKSYEKRDWQLLFRTVFNEDFNHDHKSKLADLAEILAANNQAGNSFVSPRTAVHAATLYADGGDLKYISDIDPKIIDKYFAENKDREQNEADTNVFRMIEEYIKENKLGDIDVNAQLLKIILDEHKSRGGEELEVNMEDDNKDVKISKLNFCLGLMDIHNWSKKNFDKANQKKQEVKELITELKK